MNKRLRNLIAVAAAVIVLCGGMAAVLLWLPKSEGDDTSSTTTTTAAPTFPLVDKTTGADGQAVASPVKSVTIANATGRYAVITKDDGTLSVEAYADLPADTAALSALSGSAAKLTAVTDIGDVAGKDADYGFSSPLATVQATYSDDSTYAFELGSETPYHDGYYFREQGSTHVYVVETAVGANYLNADTAYVGKAVITSPTVDAGDSSGSAKMIAAVLGGSARSAQVEIQLDIAEQYPTLTYASPYVMTAPYLRAMDDDQVLLLNTNMLTLTAAGVQKAPPTAEDLAACGLDTPRSVAAFTCAVVTDMTDTTATAADGTTQTAAAQTGYYNPRSHAVQLGGKDASGNYYAKIDNYDVIYLLSAETVPWAETPYGDMVSKLLFLTDLTSLQSVSVTAEGQTTVFELAHNPNAESKDDQLTVTVNGEKKPTGDFRTLYTLMMRMSRTGAAETQPTGEPYLTLTLQSTAEAGGGAFTVSMYSLNASRYLCVMPDGECYAVNASSVTQFVRQMNNYLAGQAVVSAN